VISRSLARHLRDAGLEWLPASGDQFFIPDRDMDGEVFSISEMTVDVRSAPGGHVIAFNGTVEWALDAIMQREVVWLPSEQQLRERLGEQFAALERTGSAFRCTVVEAQGRRSFTHERAEDAYGLALLHRLRLLAGAVSR
jgi:hypothetical protein